MALERWLIDTPWLLEPPKAIQQNPSRWEHGGWMDVPVRIEEASYFRTRCKQRWEWVHGSKPVTLVRWQAGKAVNASRFPCASPSAKAEGSADIYIYDIISFGTQTTCWPDHLSYTRECFETNVRECLAFWVDWEISDEILSIVSLSL